MSIKGNILTFEVKPGEEGLLKNYLRNTKDISRKSLSKIKNEGLILCNGVEVTVRYVVKEGDIITIQYPEEEKSEYLIPENIPLTIVYEDKDVLIINKDAGICMHPTWGVPSGTLANGVLNHWMNQDDSQSAFHAVNRLDMDTSGIVLVAKNRYAKQQLTLQQKNKTLQRSYVALVEGEIKDDKGTIELPIGRVEEHSTKRTVREDGQYALTFYEIMERYSGYSLVKVMPLTGRTHQIRVHMSHIGHPLVGDDMYGGSREHMERQALHANMMDFIHPRSEEKKSFTLSLPLDMQNIVSRLRSEN